MTLRVAFILTALEAGGAERIIGLLSEAAIERGWDATIITFDSPNDPIFHRYDPRVHLCRLDLPIRAKGLPRLSLMMRRIFTLRRLMLSKKYDVVVSFLTKVNVLALVASVGTNVPVIVSERNNPHRQKSNRLWNRLIYKLYPRAAAIVMLTERSKVCLPESQKGRAVVIPNPMLAPPYRPIANGALTLAAVGRLCDQKGFDLLIQAFAEIASKIPDWTLIIWGEGPNRRALEHQIRGLGLAGRILLPGGSEKHGSWVETATAFVLASRYEGFANVVAEAMSVGLPVAAFDCDFGPADMITHDFDGLLVPAEDPHALAETLLRLTTDRGLRQRLGKNALRGVGRYDSSRINAAWLTLIESVARPET